MEREQVIKALECCNRGTTEDCAKCPRFDDRTLSTEDCMECLMRDALSLIKELTEENERQRSEISVKRKLLDEAEVRMDCLEEVNKVLQADICNATMNLEHLTKENERLRADTVRKMQERLDKHFCHDPAFLGVEQRLIMDVIDQIAKEMVEGV